MSLIALGLELSLDTEMCAVFSATAGDGRYRVEELYYDTSLGAVAEIVRLYGELDPAGVYLDPMPCAPLLDELRQGGVWLNLLEAVDVAAAAGQFKAAFRARNVKVKGTALRESMRFAAARPLAAGFAFERRRVLADMAPLNAASHALWGFRRSEAAQDPGVWVL